MLISVKFNLINPVHTDWSNDLNSVQIVHVCHL